MCVQNTPESVQTMRWDLMGHMPAVVWLTGLPCCGKSTVAYALEARLLSMGIHCMTLDEELIDPRFDISVAHRMMLDKAALLYEAGMVALVSMTSPRREDRIQARVRFPQGLFHEVFLDVPQVICEERDLVCRYEAAKCGDAKALAGLTFPYEPHSRPELVLDGVDLDVDQCVDKLVRLLTDGGCLDRRYFKRKAKTAKDDLHLAHS